MVNNDRHFAEYTSLGSAKLQILDGEPFGGIRDAKVTIRVLGLVIYVDSCIVSHPLNFTGNLKRCNTPSST